MSFIAYIVAWKDCLSSYVLLFISTSHLTKFHTTAQYMCVQTSQSLSQRVKRCNRYGTSSITPKRPCLPASHCSAAASVNSGTPVSHNGSPENGDIDIETKTSTKGCPLTPLSSDLVSVEPNANSTHQDTSAQSLEELRRRRTELRHSISAKEQTLHNLNLVKQHRAKVCCLTE